MIHELERKMPRYRIAEALGVTQGTLYKRCSGAIPITLEAFLALRQVHADLMPSDLVRKRGWRHARIR